MRWRVMHFKAAVVTVLTPLDPVQTLRFCTYATQGPGKLGSCKKRQIKMLHSPFHVPSSTYFYSYFKHGTLQFGVEKQNRNTAFFALVYSHSAPSPGQNQPTDVEASKQSPAQRASERRGPPHCMCQSWQMGSWLQLPKTL